MKTCAVTGCSRKAKAKGMCKKHYDNARYVPVQAVCPLCGPYDPGPGMSNQYGPICPKCDMDAAEHAYRLRILADSAAVYAQEAREFNARRRAA